MKNPNGFGTVTKLSGIRRRPWMVREGKTGAQKVIGYCTTREEALILLAEYNNNPWDMDSKKVTLNDIYQLFLSKRIGVFAEHTQKIYKQVWTYIQYLSDTPFVDIKQFQKQQTIDECGKGATTQRHIRNLWTHIEELAVELGVTTIITSRSLKTAESVCTEERKPFTDEEVRKLWSIKNEPMVDIMLFMLYTGYRIGEIIAIKVENINRQEWTIKGGNKTAAGKNKIVPIHSAIMPIVQDRIEQSQSGFLFEFKGHRLHESTFRFYWDLAMRTINSDHIPHEARHTVRTKLDAAGCNTVCIDRIMGHASAGVGRAVYTHKTIEELRQTIELLNYETV